METRTLYCSACDQNVEVAVLHAPVEGAASDPSAFVCLECGTRCSGALCAITELPADTMRQRLAESGLAPTKE